MRTSEEGGSSAPDQKQPRIRGTTRAPDTGPLQVKSKFKFGEPNVNTKVNDKKRNASTLEV